MSKHIRVGLVGYCPPSKFDEDEAANMIRFAFDYLESANPTTSFELVSGWTNVGVLALGYAEAAKRGWSTYGVACKRAQEHPLFPVDHGMEVGDNWGDESDFFVSFVNCLVRVGGGEQSLAEADAVRRRGDLTIEFSLPLLPEKQTKILLDMPAAEMFVANGLRSDGFEVIETETPDMEAEAIERAFHKSGADVLFIEPGPPHEDNQRFMIDLYRRLAGKPIVVCSASDYDWHDFCRNQQAMAVCVTSHCGLVPENSFTNDVEQAIRLAAAVPETAEA